MFFYSRINLILQRWRRSQCLRGSLPVHLFFTYMYVDCVIHRTGQNKWVWSFGPGWVGYVGCAVIVCVTDRHILCHTRSSTLQQRSPISCCVCCWCAESH